MQRSGIETGTVISTEGTRATVITNKSKSCHECGKAQAGICGKQGSDIVLKVKNTMDARKGDTVIVSLDKSTHYRAFFSAFILPVIALFLFSYLGYFISKTTGVHNLDVVAGFSGFIIITVFSFIRIRGLEKSTQFFISSILNNPSLNESTHCTDE